MVPLKRSPIKRTSLNLKLKRTKPRRGRIVDRSYLSWAAEQPCCVTGELPATSHHLRSYGSPKDDTNIVRLVDRLHMHESGMYSVERLGKQKFEARFGISLEDEATKLRRRYETECPKT